jgi:hypothetical protein
MLMQSSFRPKAWCPRVHRAPPAAARLRQRGRQLLAARQHAQRAQHALQRGAAQHALRGPGGSGRARRGAHEAAGAQELDRTSPGQASLQPAP